MLNETLVTYGHQAAGLPLPVAISDIIRASEVSDHYAQICSPRCLYFKMVYS